MSFDFIRKVWDYFHLGGDLDDFDKIHESITKDIVFKGTNLWILMFAIVVASVGLNMNSTAVIIGAMLISPLMGPINGMGYSIATYNFPLFRRSIKNFSFAVVTSLVASTLYFALSPISTAHSELLARTSPTIYDVLIALFGGLAGIVAISSKMKGNVIPGVAIATALMPPLCTAGYGLATAQFNFFFGAFYLFTINTVFIALSSVAVSQILKFPIRTIVEEVEKKRVNRWISIVTALILIPSIYFGYKLVQQEAFLENAKKYVANVSVEEGNYLLKHEIDPRQKIIKLVYGGARMDEPQRQRIKDKAANFSLEKVNIKFEQGLAIDIYQGNTELENLKAEINRLNLVVNGKESLIDSMSNIRLLGQQILEEVTIMYPQIRACSYADTYVFGKDTLGTDTTALVLLVTEGGKIKKDDQEKIENWLMKRLDVPKVKVVYE